MNKTETEIAQMLKVICGPNQKEIAEMLGVTPSHLSKAKIGLHVLAKRHIERLRQMAKHREVGS